MVVLALDTTARTGSCALSRDGVVTGELASDPEPSHAEHLPGDLMTLLAAERVELDAVDVFAVATGPGSFTGMRVGIATMQGLAFATGKPLIGVSALDALAVAGTSATPGVPRTVATWVDAWRGEVYAALYEDGREVEGPTVEHPAAVLDRHRRRGEAPILFIGDGAGRCLAIIRGALDGRAVIATPVAPLLAATVAQIAHDAARRGHRPGADAIRPLYVRRMDAELARDARTSE
jgi:tRNA threonylcarbamoyladenosine biosynthesis protein TsaB